MLVTFINIKKFFHTVERNVVCALKGQGEY